tara:strand:- start:1083 stop:1331 length:249 start_codon:yes stop_codon:yes gene_type:complete
MKNQKSTSVLVKPSEILESVTHLGYEIKSLRHANTGLVLYKFPSKMHNWEDCWTIDLETAKTGVSKYMQHMKKIKENLNKIL